MKQARQKLKLLYLYDILLNSSDEAHPLTTGDIIERLSAVNITAERKTIYDDIEQLRLYGADICTVKSKSFGYYIGARTFELPELKLLVDAVSSSKFITHKKSMELIGKIETLAGDYGKSSLQRQVYMTNRVKTLNEQIYYNVDIIHDAIGSNKKIRFKYFEWGTDKKKHYRKDGGTYTESPVALMWDDENYYLICYKEKYESFTHYRVDKMEKIALDESERVCPPEKFDLSAYTKSVFGMFGGEDAYVKVRFDNSLVNPVIDRFGIEVPIIADGENHFIANISVKASRNFYAWIFSFGDKAEILSPESVRADALEFMRGILNNYIREDK